MFIHVSSPSPTPSFISFILFSLQDSEDTEELTHMGQSLSANDFAGAHDIPESMEEEEMRKALAEVSASCRTKLCCCCVHSTTVAYLILIIHYYHSAYPSVHLFLSCSYTECYTGISRQ